MRRALSMFVVEGIHTSIPLQEEILANEDFVAGRFDTSFVAKLREARQVGQHAMATPAQ